MASPHPRSRELGIIDPISNKGALLAGTFWMARLARKDISNDDCQFPLGNNSEPPVHYPRAHDRFQATVWAFDRFFDWPSSILNGNQANHLSQTNWSLFWPALATLPSAQLRIHLSRHEVCHSQRSQLLVLQSLGSFPQGITCKPFLLLGTLTKLGLVDALKKFQDSSSKDTRISTGIGSSGWPMVIVLCIKHNGLNLFLKNCSILIRTPILA